MKNIIYKTIFVLSILITYVSCDDVEMIKINSEANTMVSLSSNSLMLAEETAMDEALTVMWTEPDFGFDAAPSYRVLIDFSGGDFTNPQSIPVGTNYEYTFTEGELNSKLLSLGIVPDEPTDIDVIVQTSLSDSQEMMSTPVTFNVTAYSSLLDLSTNWGVVGSATPGGWGNPDILDLPFYTSNTSGVLIAYVTLREGLIKFRENNDWTNNYGDDGNDGTLEAGGTDIPVTAGTYKITFNQNDLTWSMEEFSWGLVGDATPNGWGGPDFKLSYNPYQDNWVGAVTLVEGLIKFRFNDDWGVNYGDDGADGSLELGGGDISVAAGHYIVTLDLNNLEYTVESSELWGLVGSATPNSWDGPDTKFLPDFGINEGVYYINGITLTEGLIKVRQIDAWAVNYGDDENDGILEAGGTDIPVSAGTYNVVFDFTGANPTLALYPW